MALRRVSQTRSGINSPDTAAGSPVSPSNVTGHPRTPRNRPSITAYRSPASTPSISTYIPFDWDAARSLRPRPYSSPVGRKIVDDGSSPVKGTPKRRGFVRKKTFAQKLSSFPSAVAFQIALFPHNVPLPSPNTSARLIGAAMHFVHFCVRVSQLHNAPDWDIYQESSSTSWLTWSTMITFLLIIVAIFNPVYVFSRTRIYQLYHRPEPVSSPHAKFVSTRLGPESEPQPSLLVQAGHFSWYAFCAFWRFLLGMQPPSMSNSVRGKTSRVQHLEVWMPGELELKLFCIYSPAHAFLWVATDASNWILMLPVMVLVGIQLTAITRAYKMLLKDKEIIAAEVLNEYNIKFVNPRVFVPRKDVSVMTHQAEMVDRWN